MRSAMGASKVSAEPNDHRLDRSLLIVEDDPDQLERLTQWFIRAGYQVVSAWHPQQALAAASARKFQAALVDASLPEIDGLEFTHRLKRLQPALQVVLLSAHGCPRQEAKLHGAVACLGERCRLDVVQDAVDEAFERLGAVAVDRQQRAGVAKPSGTT